MAVVAAIAITAMLFWKEFKILSFDPDFGATLGYRMRAIDVLMITLLVMAIVIGLQTVGVVLMSAMIVAPAVAARQWTDRLGVMVALSAFFGALAGGGRVLEQRDRAPAHGACHRGVHQRDCHTVPAVRSQPGNRVVAHSDGPNRRRIRTDTVLGDMYALAPATTRATSRSTATRPPSCRR